MKTRRRLTQQESKEVTRGRYVEAAEKLFLRKVFDDTSVEVNSEAADYSRGAFYSDLDGEDQVLLALTHRRRMDALDILDSMFHQTSECGPRSASVRELFSNRRRRKETIALQIVLLLQPSARQDGVTDRYSPDRPRSLRLC
jgi:AcrR family transcriptional regulator